MTHVLIIEDQDKLRRNLVQVLQQSGLETTAAASGEEGYRLARTQTFDAVVLDLNLPGRDGLQILTELRAAASPSPC